MKILKDLLCAKLPAGINKFMRSLIGNLQENEKGGFDI